VVTRKQKITLGEMRNMVVRGLYHCSPLPAEAAPHEWTRLAKARALVSSRFLTMCRERSASEIFEKKSDTSLHVRIAEVEGCRAKAAATRDR